MANLSLPIYDHHRFDINPVRITVLRFDPTTDLLATGDSYGLLQIYSFRQKTYVFRRQFESMVRAIEWKTNSMVYNGTLGRCRLYVGFADGSVSHITFPSRLHQVAVEYTIICHPNLSGPINRLSYAHDKLVTCNDTSITFWCDKTGSDSWEKQKTLNVAELNPNASGLWGKGIENIAIDSPRSCVIVWDGGYILHLDIQSFKPLWAAQPLKAPIMIHSTLSSCRRFMILRAPGTLQLKQILGTQPPFDFVVGPPDLRELHSLPCEDLYLGLNNNDDIITWNAQTGAVLHYVDHQDFKQHIHFITGVARPTYSPPGCTEDKVVSVTVAAVTAKYAKTYKPPDQIETWYFHLSRKIHIVKDRFKNRQKVNNLHLPRANVVVQNCRGLCRRTKDCQHWRSQQAPGQ